MSQYTLIRCPTCRGIGSIPESTDEHERKRAIDNALQKIDRATADLACVYLRDMPTAQRAKNELRDALAELRRVGVVK